MTDADRPELSDPVARAAKPEKVGKPDKTKQQDKKAGDHGKGRGKLVLSVGGVETALPPGHAVALAVAACGGTVEGLTVDAVRAAAPEAVQVCEAVSLRSQVTAADDEVTEGDPV